MENPSSFAVSVEKTLAICIEGEERDQFDLSAGTLIEVKERKDRFSTVIVHDFYRKNFAFENNLYLVKTSTLQFIPQALWPFIAAVSDPLDRVYISRDKLFINYITDIRIDSLLAIDGRYFDSTPQRSSSYFQDPKDRYKLDYQCIVRYIGKVDEISPGTLFGLELLSLDKGISPQAPEICHFASKYVSGCDPNHVFLLPINFIRKPTSKYIKKQFKSSSSSPSVLSNLICGIKDIVKPSPSSRTLVSNANKYYLSENSGSDSSPPAPTSATSQRPLTPDLVDNSKNGKMSSGTKLPSSISSPNLAKQDSGSSSSSNRYSDLISFCEDYTKSIEEHEKKIEERRMSQSRSSILNGESRTPKASKKTLQFPGAPNREIKPSTILSLADRDLIVIDKHDIKEAVKNESQVIIVDPPSITPAPVEEHADLADILGNNWPDHAGHAGALLNNDKKTSTSSTSGSSSNGYRTFERNKSANIASHLSSSKPRYESTSNGYENNKTLPKKKQNGAYENLDQDTSSVASDPISDCIVPSPLIDIPGSKLGLGSLVEVDIGEEKLLHGVIRWIGQKTNSEGVKMNGHNDLIIGVELDEPFTERRLKVNLTDGVYNGQRCFRCLDRRALFVSQKRCKPDRRFPDENQQEYNKGSSGSLRSSTPSEGRAFGAECPIIEGSVAPLKFVKFEDLDSHCGKFKGIQGHHNSCYLDATLFSMFTFTSVFDSLLFRPREQEDCEQYEEVQRVLREEIVNPLRKKLFVRADRVMKLRQLLDKLSSVKGLVSEEKDPEEFLNSLVAQILRAEPFLKLSSGLDTFCYQLFVEKDERMTFPTVQQLFEQSFLDSEIKLKEVPSCLIIQMPRFGKNYKMYPRILPSQVLDVTDIIEDSPRQCTICGTLAEFECKECFGVCNIGSGLESTAFCHNCLSTVHSHQKRVNHKAKQLSIPNDFKIMAEFNQVPRLFMELFAVICIETSHYVSFVKCGSGLDSPWVFFDSMADRKGERDGYNIPEMVSVPELPVWLSEEGSRQLHEANINDKHLPEFARRLYCDAYLMLYQSTEMMMYK